MKRNKVKEYRGAPATAEKLYLKDAAKLAGKGYFPVSQNYVQGAWGCGSFLLALLLCFVLIGILIFIYMMIVKPTGTLVVTYEYRDFENSNDADEKICPICAETIRQAAIKCRFCGYQYDF